MSALLKRIDRAQRPPFHRLSAVAARDAYLAAAEVLDLPRAPLPRVSDLKVPTGDGRTCAARLYDAGGDSPSPVLLYFHGGGFVIGDIETHDSLCRQLALRSGTAVLSLDYRLAPEHRFPAAVNDAFSALRWLQASAAGLGLDGERLAVGGDSAGGTLATVCALLARDTGLPVRLQLLITPGTGAHADTPSHRRFANGYLLDAETIAWFFDQYIPLDQRDDWRFAPLNASELEGVAPACVILAECDPLVDEGLAYIDRLRMAGVAVELELYRGLTHDFIKMGRALPEAEHAQQAAANALRKAFLRP